jgi:hypothetical protein
MSPNRLGVAHRRSDCSIPEARIRPPETPRTSFRVPGQRKTSLKRRRWASRGSLSSSDPATVTSSPPRILEHRLCGRFVHRFEIPKLHLSHQLHSSYPAPIPLY